MTKNAPTATPAPKISKLKTWLSKQWAWFAPLLVGLTHSALMMLAAPPVNAWPAVFVALLPLAWLANRPATRPWRDALLVTIGVLPMWGVWEWWTSEVTGVGYVPFICLQASYVGLFLLAARRIHRLFPRIPLALVVPTIWTAVEFFRGEIFLDGYAWGLLAHPLIAVTALASPAALLGTYFVSFLAAAFNGALADLFFAHRRRAAVIAIGCCAAAWIAGAASLPSIDPAAPQVHPAIVQTNVRQSNKIGWSAEEELQDWKRFTSLTLDAAGNEESSAHKPDLILWPETMVPGASIEPDAVKELKDKGLRYRSEDGRYIEAWAFADGLNQLQKDCGVPMIVGALARVGFHVNADEQGRLHDDQRSIFNSVYLINAGAVQPIRYDKVRLTPFGETMPYIHYWPWLQEKMLSVGANGMKFDLDAGTQMTVLDVPAASLGRSIRVVTPVCFEITVASHCRALVFDHGRRRADLIASITNDGWFSDTDIARLQHLQAARWRCVELATPMARAANTGISALVDAHGRVVARGVEGNQYGARVDGILIGQVPLGTKTTLYARVGDIFGWTAFFAGLLALIASFFRRRASPSAELDKGKA